MTAIAVIYNSATGNVDRLAEGVVAGVRAAGAEVRLRRVAELAPDDAIRANPAWAEHRIATAEVPEVSLEDLRCELANKAATSFTSASNVHGGQDSTILALNNVLYHWGAVALLSDRARFSALQL